MPAVQSTAMLRWGGLLQMILERAAAQRIAFSGGRRTEPSGRAIHRFNIGARPRLVKRSPAAPVRLQCFVRERQRYSLCRRAVSPLANSLAKVSSSPDTHNGLRAAAAGLSIAASPMKSLS